MIKCALCGERICKYSKDFNNSGAITISVGKDLEPKDICLTCAKEVALELINNIE